MRRILAALGAVALAAALSFPVMAAPQPLALANWSGQIQDPVEQLSPDWKYASNVYNRWQCTNDGSEQDMAAGTGTAHPDNCIHNPWRDFPDRCIWDVDDHYGKSGAGYMNTGATISASLCSVADTADNSGGDDHTVDVLVYSPAKTLTVTMTDNRGHSWTAAPVASGSGWNYIICYRESEVAPFDVIPGSNGGAGRRLDYSLTVTASRKTNGIAAYFSVWGWLREYGSIRNCPNIYAPWM